MSYVREVEVIDEAEDAQGRGTTVSRIILSCLVVLFLSATAALASSLYFFVSRITDQSIAACEALIIISSLLSLLYVVAHMMAMIQFRKNKTAVRATTILQSTCFVLIRLNMILCFVAMAASMAVLFRRTTSLLSQERLQQASVGFSLFSLVISLILFCALEVSKQPFTWLNYRKRSSDPERQRPVSSLSDDNKRDVEDFCRTGKYDRVELLLPRNQSSNSVTTSDLPLPSPLSPALSTGTSTPSWGAAWMHVIPIDLPESPSIDPPMPSPSPAFPGQWPLRSPSPSERPPLRMQRTLSSKSSIYSRGSTLRRSPLSTMRTADCPDVPILPELPKIRRKPLPTEWDLPTALIPGAWKPQLFDAPSEVRLERMTEQQQSLYKDLGLIAEPIAPCVENTKMGKRRRNDSQKWKTQPIARSRAIAQRNGPMGSRGSKMGY